jgi:predicted phage terminase large subunit-like protein
LKLPTLAELIKDPKARDSLTDAQLSDFINRLRGMTKGWGRPVGFIDNPADLAIHLSGGRWVEARHLRYLSNQIVRLEKREIKRLMVSMPPRHGKSFEIDYYTPTWWLTRHPRDEIILASYGEVFARKWGGMVRDLILEHSEYLNLVLSKDRTAADDWSLTSGGGMISTGAHGTITGRGANLLIIDDPIKNEEEANSPTHRDKIWDWWQATSNTRLEPDAVVILVATRWHEDDLLGRLSKEEEMMQDWTVVRIPALAEKNDVLGRAEGDPLWPERFHDDPMYEVKQRSMSPYWWSALYQQRPTPEGGGILLRDWWQFYREVPENCDQWIQTWDMALKDTATSDYTVGQVWARKGASMYLVKQVRGHFNLHQIANHMRNLAQVYPQARAKLVEDTAMGPAIKQTLQHEVPGIIPVPVKGSKNSRVQASVPYVMGGNVYLPENRDGSKPRWVWDFIEEAAVFDKGAYDDQVDAFTLAVFFMLPGGWADVAREARAKEEEKEATPSELRREWFQTRFVDPAKKKMQKQLGERRISRPRMW